MNNRKGFNKLGRKASHRKALHNNLVTSLLRYERVKTTKAKAVAIKRTAEKMVTRAKEDSVHNRRIIAKRIHDKEVLAKLFLDIAPRYIDRPGGYTRVLKMGFRKNDAAEMVLLELFGTDEESEDTKKSTKKKKKQQ